MKTVVEGIESEWRARILQLQGCDYLQDYELGVPMPVNELAEILQRGHDDGDDSRSAAIGTASGLQPLSLGGLGS